MFNCSFCGKCKVILDKKNKKTISRFKDGALHICEECICSFYDEVRKKKMKDKPSPSTIEEYEQVFKEAQCDRDFKTLSQITLYADGFLMGRAADAKLDTEYARDFTLNYSRPQITLALYDVELYDTSSLFRHLHYSYRKDVTVQIYTPRGEKVVVNAYVDQLPKFPLVDYGGKVKLGFLEMGVYDYRMLDF